MLVSLIVANKIRMDEEKVLVSVSSIVRNFSCQEFWNLRVLEIGDLRQDIGQLQLKMGN